MTDEEEPTRRDQSKITMREVYRRRLTELGGQFQAWVREGAKDLHNAVVPAFPGSAKSVDEPGTPLTPTQAAVDRSTGGRMTLADLRGSAKAKEVEARQRAPDQTRELSGPEV